MPNHATTLRCKPASAKKTFQPVTLQFADESVKAAENSMAANASKAATSVSAASAAGRSTPLASVELLYSYVAAYPDDTIGDELGTLFGCVAIVLISSLLLGTESPEVLSYTTTYPESFVVAVFCEFDRQQFWMTESWVEMVEVASDETKSLKAMYDSLMWVLEVFWRDLSSEGQNALGSLRSRALFGGAVQTWIDNDAAEYYGLKGTTA